MRQKTRIFAKDFFLVTDLHPNTKTKTTILQWFQRRVLGFLKMDQVEIRGCFKRDATYRVCTVQVEGNR
ncbi:hypothetical protein NIES3974_38100 [Calothrix sp. NIES-3974]|nr:hypothetical protein NIES3974_38100 [Calothrix sp. NIES-3974]